MLNLKINSLHPIHVFSKNLKQNILLDIRKRLLQSEHVNIMLIVLDPRFKNIHFQDPVACSKIIRNVKVVLTTPELQMPAEEEILNLRVIGQMNLIYGAITSPRKKLHILANRVRRALRIELFSETRSNASL